MTIKEEIKTALLKSGEISAEECAAIVMNHGGNGWSGKQIQEMPEAMVSVLAKALRSLAAEGMQLRQVGNAPRRGTAYERFCTGYSIVVEKS